MPRTGPVGRRWRWKIHEDESLKAVKHREAARRYYHKKRKGLPTRVYRRIHKMGDIDPKFHIAKIGNRLEIIKTTNGEVIPEDEPLMLLRARDTHAIATLMVYQDFCRLDSCTDFHMADIEDRITAFRKFRSEHPEQMKQPGIPKGK